MGDGLKRTRPPAKPWRVYGARGMGTDYRSQRSAYEAVKVIVGLGVTAKVYHWEEGRWIRYEEIAAPVSECGYCGVRIAFLGSNWTTGDGTIACTDTSGTFVPHKPKEN